MISNPVLDAAFKRAALIGFLMGIGAFVGARTEGIGWEKAIYAGVAVLVAQIILRGFGEGGWDANRASNNNVNEGDVPVAAPDVAVVQGGDQ